MKSYVIFITLSFTTYLCSMNFDQELMQAAVSGNIEQVKLALANSAAINYQDREGLTSLALAVSAGHINVIELLLAKGADTQIKNKKGFNAIDSAKDHLLATTQFLKLNTNIRELLLGQEARLKLIIKMLEKYPNILSRALVNPNKKLFFKAIKHNYIGIANILLKAGIAVSQEDLTLARQHSRKEIYDLILEQLKLTTKYGLISHNGIVGIHNLPTELADYIARFLHE